MHTQPRASISFDPRRERCPLLSPILRDKINTAYLLKFTHSTFLSRDQCFHRPVSLLLKACVTGPCS